MVAAYKVCKLYLGRESKMQDSGILTAAVNRWSYYPNQLTAKKERILYVEHGAADCTAPGWGVN